MTAIKKLNIPLIILPVLIFSLGYVTLLSTAPGLAKTHLILFILGYVLYVLVGIFDYRLLAVSNSWKYIFLFSVVLLFATYVLGITREGAERWLNLGLFTFQPSELSKVALILFLTFFISQSVNLFSNMKRLILMFVYLLPLLFLVFVQPDLGTTVILTGVTGGVLFAAGLNKIYILLALLIFGIVSNPLWNLLQDYQKRRILVFFNPTMDVLGSGYNVIQALIAIGSGGLLGMGFGKGTQTHLNYLPVYWTDFIFAAFAEEWGFVGVLVLLFLYIVLLLALLHVASKSKNTAGYLLVIAVFLIFLMQFVINVGMNLGMLPVTGITLPLVSHGGTSMLVSFILLGLVQSVWVYRK